MDKEEEQNDRYHIQNDFDDQDRQEKSTDRTNGDQNGTA